MPTNFSRNNHTERGFTLVEIIVSLMIFSIVVVVALAALVKVIDANRKAQTTQDAVIGLSFALESMSRELRTSPKIHCVANSSGSFTPTPSMSPSDCSLGRNQLLVFQSAVTDTVSSPPCRLHYAYLFSGSGPYVVKKATQPKGTNCSSSFSTSDYYDLVSSNVIVNDYQVGVLSDPNFAVVPIAFIRLTGYAGLEDKTRTDFTIQTAASSRVQ